MLWFMLVAADVAWIESDFDLSNRPKQQPSASCDDAPDGDVVVCGKRDQPMSELLREELKRAYRDRSPPNRIRMGGILRDAGETGPGSCSAVGPGGWTGCMAKGWRADRERSAWGAYR